MPATEWLNKYESVKDNWPAKLTWKHILQKK